MKMSSSLVVVQRDRRAWADDITDARLARRRPFQNLLKSLAVHRRQATESARNLSKLGHRTAVNPL